MCLCISRDTAIIEFHPPVQYLLSPNSKWHFNPLQWYSNSDNWLYTVSIYATKAKTLYGMVNSNHRIIRTASTWICLGRCIHTREKNRGLFKKGPSGIIRREMDISKSRITWARDCRQLFNGCSICMNYRRGDHTVNRWRFCSIFPLSGASSCLNIWPEWIDIISISVFCIYDFW